MPRPTIPPQVLAARGVPVRLIDEHEVRVCYTFHSLMLLEERFGGLEKAMSALADPEGAQFTSIVGLLAAGLEHEFVDVPGENVGEMVHVRLDNTEQLSFLLDAAEIATYATAMGEAFKRSFPNAKAAVPEGGADPTGASRGLSGSTSAQSTSAGPPTSSGA